jgi:hypothetical protein
MNKAFFTCSFPSHSEDQDNAIEVWNQGIDSHLEGFTLSEFYFDHENRLYLRIMTAHEFQILVRRLLELATESAEMLADDMILVQYDYEVI